MPLKPDMNRDEIRSYLEADLKESIQNDIGPVLQLGAKQGGYFAVPRSVLSYVDFLGALYRGYGGERDRRSGRRVIATARKAQAFIREILGVVDPLYKETGGLLYEMYRHGTVHLYRPHHLKRPDGRVLHWLSFKGSREDWIEALDLKVRHLRPVTKDRDSDWLPVSITCLYNDLVQALDVFWLRLQGDVQLLENWRAAAAALCVPEETRRRWST